MAAPKIKLKLLIDIKAKKVLLAEAGKDFIDFLIHLLCLPVGTTFRSLKDKSMVAGSLYTLFESTQNLPDAYWQPNHSKTSVQNPKPPVYATGIPLMMSDIVTSDRTLYSCSTISHAYVPDLPNLLCPYCKQNMTDQLTYVYPSRKNTGLLFEGGFVKGLVTYMVMDNLEFRPMCTKDFVTLFNNLRDKKVTELEEVVVDLGMDEGLKLLEASMKCKTVLTSVYLDNI